MLTSKAFPPRIALHEVAHRVASTWAVPKHLLVSGLSLALSLGIGDGLAYAAPAAAQQAGYVPGRLLIQQRAGLSEAEMDNALKPHGGKRVGKINGINVHVVQLPAGASTEAVAATLARNKHFKFVELDRIVRPVGTTNDPSLASQWHLAKIGAPTAWDSSTGNNVIVAILDTGVDGTHPDLTAQMVPGWNAYDNNSNTADVYGHGTAVAGTAAAAGNNGVGVASVAYRSKIMPIRISDLSGYAYFSTMANGLTWAADHGAKVANISFENVPTSSSVDSAAQYLKSKGGVTVVAAGNSGTNTSVATTGNLVIVSATDSNDVIASWSSYGTQISICAPGVSILTTNNGGGYGYWSGTSFSSPVVAGSAALMMSINPALPPSQIQSLLYSTSVDLGAAGKDIYYGAGRVNAAAATQAAASAVATDTQSPTVSISAPTGGTVSGLVTVDVAASDNVGVTRVDLAVNGQIYASDTTSPFGFSWDTTKTPNGAATLVAYAYDAAGNYAGSQSVSVTVSNGSATPDTTPPTVAITSPVSGAKVGNMVTITGTASDNLGTSGITQTLAIDGKVVATATGGSLSTNWNTRKVATGNHILTLTAKDAAGNSASNSITVVK